METLLVTQYFSIPAIMIQRAHKQQQHFNNMDNWNSLSSLKLKESNI